MTSEQFKKLMDEMDYYATTLAYNLGKEMQEDGLKRLKDYAMQIDLSLTEWEIMLSHLYKKILPAFTRQVQAQSDRAMFEKELKNVLLGNVE